MIETKSGPKKKRTAERKPKADNPSRTTKPGRATGARAGKADLAASVKDPTGPRPEESRRAYSTEERREMIARSAYFKAMRRGFQGGNPLRDWLEAEAEVDAQLLDRNRKPTE